MNSIGGPSIWFCAAYAVYAAYIEPAAPEPVAAGSGQPSALPHNSRYIPESPAAPTGVLEKSYSCSAIDFEGSRWWDEAKADNASEDGRYDVNPSPDGR